MIPFLSSLNSLLKYCLINKGLHDCTTENNTSWHSFFFYCAQFPSEFVQLSYYLFIYLLTFGYAYTCIHTYTPLKNVSPMGPGI